MESKPICPPTPGSSSKKDVDMDIDLGPLFASASWDDVDGFPSTQHLAALCNGKKKTEEVGTSS